MEQDRVQKKPCQCVCHWDWLPRWRGAATCPERLSPVSAWLGVRNTAASQFSVFVSTSVARLVCVWHLYSWLFKMFWMVDDDSSVLQAKNQVSGKVRNFPSSVQSLSCIQLFATPWTAAHQASLSITNSRSLLKLMSIESVMDKVKSWELASLTSKPDFFLRSHTASQALGWGGLLCSASCSCCLPIVLWKFSAGRMRVCMVLLDLPSSTFLQSIFNSALALIASAFCLIQHLPGSWESRDGKGETYSLLLSKFYHPFST